VQNGLSGLERRYGNTIGWLLKNRFRNFIRVAVTLVIGGAFYFFLGSEMMPLADTGQASAQLEMQPGTSFAGTEAAVHQIEAIMLKHPELRKASVEVGTESMFESWTPFFTGYQMPSVNGAEMMLTFSDKDARRATIFQLMDSIQREALARVPGIRRFQIKEMGSDVMATAEAPVHVNVYGPDLAELDHIGSQVLQAAQKMPELAQPGRTWALGLPDYRIQVNLQRAQQVGLSSQDIADQAYYATRGGLTETFYLLPNLRQGTVLVRYRPEDRTDLDDLILKAPGGLSTPLKSVATIVPESSPTAIEHDNLRRVIGITGYYRPGNLPSMDVVMNLVANAYGGNAKLGISPVNFPPGYGLEMRGDMTQMMDSFRRLLYGLAISLGLMYLVLVIQFKGFLQPLQMLASLPLELAGVFVALWLAHAAFSTVSILGIIVLTGMDITTAVLMIDLIMRYRAEDLPRDQAIAAACPDRLRPILMTSGITLLVMLPVALTPKTGLDAYQPLAVAVVGGLISGTVLSLFDIPIMHTYIDDIAGWVKGKRWRQ
jgi:HAE1 family hydrophobic/amphiphilic exporter-1